MRVLALVIAAVAAQAQPQVALQPVASGFAFSAPVAIAHAGDARLFVVEQAGRIRIYDGTVVLPTPFLDIRPLVSAGGERGLLGLAFHPRYAQNGFFYVNYTSRDGNTVIARYQVSATDPDRASADTARPILLVAQPFSNHNGGQLQFGPDGYLYIGLGDGGSGGDPGNRAQSTGDLLGKMLRIDVDGGDPYAVPPSNPFIGRAGARSEIWAVGLRNPWRYSFDRLTGDLWIADVGQGSWEEIDFQPGTSIGGENYGWRRMEGTHCFNPSSNCNSGTLTLPVIEYDHSGGRCSVTGGFVYRGARSPRLNGTYLYADFCTGTIWGARGDAAGQVTSELLVDAPFQISTFGEDAAGEVYVAGYNTGVVFRIADVNPLPPRRRAVRK